MTPQVMQEYLVSLGFSVDQAKARSFQDVLKGTASSAAKLSGEVVAAGIAMTEMVEQVAKQFSDLYYMSQRTGATVTNLQAVSYAATQVGVSASEAQGAIESFASAMRRQPGLRSLFQGVTGRAATGDAEVDIRNFVRSQRGTPDFIALQRADALGIGEHTYLQYKNNLDRLESAEVEYVKRIKEAHLDYTPDDRRWVDFENTLGHLASQFGIVGRRIAEDFRPGVQGVIEDLDRMVGRFGAADVASNGTLGTAAGAVGAAGAGTGIMALIGKIFGFKTGAGLRTAGSIGAPLAAMALMNDSNAKDVTDLRTGLRAMFGIEDPHEPLPWAPGGNWDFGQPGNAAYAQPTAWPGKSGAQPPPPGMPKTSSSSRVWGEQEAIDNGLYDPAVPLPRARPGADMTINQTNNFGDVRDLEMTIDRVKETNRELGSALRNLQQKVQ